MAKASRSGAPFLSLGVSRRAALNVPLSGRRGGDAAGQVEITPMIIGLGLVGRPP
jgi:hypothetical protein